MQTSPIDRYDLTIVADFSSHSDDCWRIGEEVRCAAGAGYTIGLVNVAHSGAKVHPDIAACLFEGHAVPARLDAWIETRLLLIATPHRVGGDELEQRPHIRARQILAIITDWPEPKSELAVLDARLRFLFGEDVLWTATTGAALVELSKRVRVAADTWPVVIASSGRRKLRPGAVIGTIRFDATLEPPLSIEGFRTLALDRNRTAHGFAFDEITLGQFLTKVDCFAFYDSGAALPATAIGKALELRIPVFLPPELRPAFEQGPFYVRREDLPQRLQRLHRQRPHPGGSARTRRPSSIFNSESEFIGRLLRLSGPPGKRPAKRRPPRDRIFLVSSNGIGIGHLTRLLSVARRFKREVEPVFITFSQGASILEQFGYAFHYLPSQTHAGIDYAAWNAWLRSELDELLAAHDPAAIVFDGNNPYPGLLAAATHQSQSRLCWIRRGMWRPAHDANFLDGARHFDLILEPDDIAAAVDRGATTDWRGEVLSVPPIRLLDEEEVLSREKACAELGLDPRKPAVLIQLGSGGNRDVAYLIDVAIEALARYRNVQIAVVEWLVGTERLKLWPGVRLIRGFPVSRYVNAFDFTVATASYNTFNEAMSYGLPAIFVPNEHASMDDQSARAAFAETNGAGFHLPEGQVREIDGVIETLMDPTTRTLIRLNALRIAKPNGAAAAAEAIQSLAGHG